MLRPYTALKLSLRISAHGGRRAEAAAEVKRLVEKNTPYNAVVDFARTVPPPAGTHRPLRRG